MNYTEMMKFLKSFIKKNWPTLLIILITFVVWQKLLDQTFFGEGFYYFDRLQSFLDNSRTIDFSAYDSFAKIIFDILIPIFHDNITYYLAFQLATMIFLNLTFYYTIYQITKEKWLSFSSSIVFSVSYIGLFEMLGTGNYQRFVQRVPNLILLLWAFLFLTKYLENKKTRNLIFSYIIFTLAVFLAHFSSFLMPLFVVYAAVWSLMQKNKFSSLIKNFIVTLPFPIINYILIAQDSLRPKWGMLSFILQNKNIIRNIVLQFTSLNLPPIFIDKISNLAQPFSNTLIIFTVPIIIIYIAGFFLIRKKYPKLKIIYATSLIMIPILLFLSLYLGKVNPEFDISGFHYYYLPDYYIGKIDTFTAIKGDRYYLVPMFFVAIIWSSLILLLFKNKKKAYKFFSLSFLFIYILYNTSLIWDKFERLLPLVKDQNSYITYIRSLKNQFKPNTTLIVPEYFLWPSNMIRVFYGYPDMQFFSSRHNWMAQVNPKYLNEVMIIDYDYKTKNFYNLTSQYKSGKKLILKSY